MVLCLHVHLCSTGMQYPWRSEEGTRVLYNWSYRQLLASVWVLGIKLKPVGKIAIALNL